MNLLNLLKNVKRYASTIKEVNNDSISNIVKPKEENNLSKFKLFVDMYLYSIKNYFENVLLY